MRRTDLLDTSDWAHREMVKRLRAMTPAQRAAVVVSYAEMLRQMKVANKSRREANK